MRPVVAGFDVEEHEVLAGKYRVERRLGRGGMGVVVSAHHLQLDERVAIKLMLPEVTQNGEAVARFMREARAAAKIKSEHVCRVSDVGVLDGGQPYMVLEYLVGEDLGAIVASAGRLPVADAVEYVLQACEAIAEAHALGIVHRDLKPSNLYLTHRVDGTPVVKVLDFGISKVSPPAGDSSGSPGSSDGAMTRTAALMGSPLYMSPEQMTSSRDVDARSDIWSLGVILYELLSGVPPFQAVSLPQVCALILQGDYPPLRSRTADVPEAVSAVIARCLAKDRSERFASVAELAAALTDFAPPRARVSLDRIRASLRTVSAPSSGARAESAPGPSTGASSPTAPSSGTQASWGETAAPRNRRGLGLVTLGAVLLGALVLGGIFVANFRKAPASPALPASAGAPEKTSVEASPAVPAKVAVPAASAPDVVPLDAGAAAAPPKGAGSSEKPPMREKNVPRPSKPRSAESTPLPASPPSPERRAPEPAPANTLGGRL
jgi:serine/threonine protein kinase